MLAIVTLVVGYYAVSWRFDKRWTIVRIDQAVRAGLPIGADRGQAEAWFRSMKIPFHYKEYANSSNFDKYGNETVAEMANLRQAELNGLVRAVIENANISWMWNGHIDVYVFFNLNEKVVGYLFVPRVESF